MKTTEERLSAIEKTLEYVIDRLSSKGIVRGARLETCEPGSRGGTGFTDEKGEDHTTIDINSNEYKRSKCCNSEITVSRSEGGDFLCDECGRRCSVIHLDYPKTIKEWFESVEDEGLRELLLERYVEGYGSVGEKVGAKFRDMVLQGFHWRCTDEGWQFWEDVANGKITTYKKKKSLGRKMEMLFG